MCHLLESICWEKGNMELLDLHINRMNRSRKLLFGINTPIYLAPDLKPPENLNHKWKLRIIYKKEIEKIEWIPYTKSIPKKVLVLDAGQINYDFKYAKRESFEKLKNDHPDFDDFILIRDNFLTDGSYSNLVLKIGDRWLTPSTPLLKGVRRESLLKKGKISEHPLKKEHLLMADEIRLINALLPLDDAIVLKTDQLFFSKKA